jgi:hypothetical protein
VSDEHDACQATEDEAVQILKHPHGWHGNRRRPVRRTVLSPRWLTGAAVVLAGHKRSAVGEEWRRHLLGESAQGLTHKEQIRAARGFVWAAVCYRLHDAADLAWRPVDAVLGSRTLSNLTVWIPVLAAMLVIVRHDRLYGLITNASNLIELWGGLYAAIRVGRWYRRMKPKRKPRRARE